MLSERKNRTPNQVTADILIERLRTDQLLKLVGLREYASFQERILNFLQTKNGFSLDDFSKVHPSSKGCNANIINIGQTIYVRGETEYSSWGNDIPLKQLKCDRHGVTSVEYFTYEGVTQEGPFQR